MKDEECSCLDRRLLRVPFDPMKDLDSYLNDHLAGSISALELIAHWVDVHKGEALGSFFVETEREIKADQETLRDSRSRGKQSAKSWCMGSRKAWPRTIDSCRQRAGELGIGVNVGRIDYGNHWKETNVGCVGSGEIATVKHL